MKKFYIPTSSLNFNNILSTESLSPKSFYASRDFGIPRWTSVAENRFDEAITLYDSPHQFSRPDSDVEDHPLLIEIQTNQNFEQIQNGIYLSYESIYLNPWDTKFIFFSEEHKRIALILYESSFEAKLLRLYIKKIIVKNFDGTFPHIKVTEISASSKKDEKLSNDNKINKLKGLLYGYYIGGLLSTSAENVHRLSTLEDINNILNSVITSPFRKASSSQRERLRNDLCHLQFNSGILGKFISLFNSDLQLGIKKAFLKNPEHFFEFCIAHELIDKYPAVNELLSAIKRIDKPRNSKISDSYNSNTFNPVQWINKKIQEAVDQIKVERNIPSLNEISVTSAGINYINSLPDVNDEYIYMQCINELFLLPKYRGKISSYNAELADKITDIVKHVLGNQWQDSPKRDYLNKLRRHIGGEDFPCDWNNTVLPSIAAVLLSGDDWERLLRFMQSKGMNDYRLAFSIYGVLHGFANLLRDFTDILLILEDKNIVASVYSTFNAQLFGKKLTHINNSLKDKFHIIQQHKDDPNYQISLFDSKQSQTNMNSLKGFTTPEQSSNPLVVISPSAPADKHTLPSTVERPAASAGYSSSDDLIRDAIDFIYNSSLKDRAILKSSLLRIRDKLEGSTDPHILMKLLENNETWITKGGKPRSAWKKLKVHFGLS